MWPVPGRTEVLPQPTTNSQTTRAPALSAALTACPPRGESPSAETRAVIGCPGPLGAGRPMGKALIKCEAAVVQVFGRAVQPAVVSAGPWPLFETIRCCSWFVFTAWAGRTRSPRSCPLWPAESGTASCARPGPMAEAAVIGPWLVQLVAGRGAGLLFQVICWVPALS